MDDEAAAYVSRLSEEERQALRALDRAELGDRLKAAGLKKMGVRLKVEVLLSEGSAGTSANRAESSSVTTEAAEEVEAVTDISDLPPPSAHDGGSSSDAPISIAAATATAIATPAAANSEVAATTAAARSSSSFYPADTFTGKRPGFIFKMDTKGLGYYLEKSNPEAKLKGKMFGNMSWLSEDAELEVEAAKQEASEAAAAATAAAAAASAQSASPKAVTTLALPGAAPKAPPEPGRLSVERKAILEKQAGEFAPPLKEGKYAEKGEVVRVNGKKWALVKDIKCGSYEVVYWDAQGIYGGTTCHFSELETTTLSLKRWMQAKQKWDLRTPLARKTLLDDRRGHVHKSWTGPSINEMRITDKSMPGKGYYAGVVPSVPVLMPPKIDPAEVKKETGDDEAEGTKARSGYYYAHRRKIDFKVPTPAPKPM